MSAQQLLDELVAELVRHRHASGHGFYGGARLPRSVPFDILTFDVARDEAAFHRRMLARLNAIGPIDGSAAIEAGVLRHVFELGAHADEDYWLELAATPYTGGDRLVRGLDIVRSAGEDLLGPYAELVAQAGDKARAQAARGIRIAKPAIEGARATFRGVAKAAQNLAGPDAAKERIVRACEAAVAIFDDEYVRQAPDEVGLWRYPGGRERYLRLIQYEGYGLTPEEIHALAKRQIADVEDRMRGVRDDLGFRATAEEFHAALRVRPQLVVRTAEELEAKYDVFMGRMLPLLPKYFRALPSVPYGYQRLEPALDDGTRGGGGRQPTAADPVGRYVYPTFDLANRSLEVAAAHRIYHELAPGHVFQRELFNEHGRPSNLRTLRVRFPGYAEGWAEYAASLGIEMGAFADPYDLYLQLLAEANNASRSVIDTGMNYLGMTLEEARAYLRAHSPIMSDVAVRSETLRFGADTFGYCLSYRMGYVAIWELRRRAERALGSRFDLRDLHSAILDDGALPLDVLGQAVDRYIANA